MPQYPFERLDTSVAEISTIAAIPKLHSSSLDDKNENPKSKISYEKKPQEDCKSSTETFWAKVKWFNISYIIVTHSLGIWALIFFPYLQNLRLVVWTFTMGHLAGLGVTGGVHRLWTHRSYKANLPLRIFMMLCFAIAAQNNIYDWVRDHRVHHKYTETDADPHNSKRGFFFAHCGWLMTKKHPEVIRRGREVDMSDILEDPVAEFHKRHFLKLKLLMGFIIPVVVPPLCWNQDWFWSFMIGGMGRHILGLNSTWLVNSAAHIFGNKPYDKSISPSENLFVSICAIGEGWHNYHHTFPWDYKTAELGKYAVNATAFWIDLFAAIGWAYELKTASKELIETVVKKRGDGSHSPWSQGKVPASYINNKSN